MSTTPRIRPCLWFNDQGEEAARFYTGIFPNSRIVATTRFSEAGFEIHQRPSGSVMTVTFELDGQQFTALNGGPMFTFNEAVSLQVNCATQEEIDHYWEKLSAGGDQKAQQCGWLKDRYGLSWQVGPAIGIPIFTAGRLSSNLEGTEAQRAILQEQEAEAAKTQFQEAVRHCAEQGDHAGDLAQLDPGAHRKRPQLDLLTSVGADQCRAEDPACAYQPV